MANEHEPTSASANIDHEEQRWKRERRGDLTHVDQMFCLPETKRFILIWAINFNYYNFSYPHSIYVYSLCVSLISFSLRVANFLHFIIIMLLLELIKSVIIIFHF